MGLQVHQYKVAGILVRIMKTHKSPKPVYAKRKVIQGGTGGNVFLISVGNMRDSAFTMKKARERANNLALKQFNENARTEARFKASDDLFTKTGCPF